MITNKKLRHVALVALACTAMAGCDMFTSTETRIERAETQIAAREYRAAVIELRNALQKEPGNGRASPRTST